MQGKKTQRRSLRGSYTIEMTLIMGIILPVIIALMISGFFVHDRNMMQGAACEGAARGSCMVIDEKDFSKVSKAVRTLGKTGSVWARNVTGNSGMDENRVSVSLTGSFSFPGYTAELLNPESKMCSGNWERKILHPAKLIRKVRGMKAFTDRITETGSG